MHLPFSFIILFLLVHLIIHHPSWDTGLGSECNNVHHSALKSSKCSLDAYNETYHYLLLLLLCMLCFWVITPKQEVWLVHFSGFTGIWKGGPYSFVVCHSVRSLISECDDYIVVGTLRGLLEQWVVSSGTSLTAGTQCYEVPTQPHFECCLWREVHIPQWQTTSLLGILGGYSYALPSVNPVIIKL